MHLFLLVVMLVYGAMNSYLFWKTHQAFPNMGKIHYALAAFLLVMIATPLLARLLERERPTFGTLKGLMVYGWLAIVFWFCCAGLAGDVWNLAVKGISHLSPAAGKLFIGSLIQWVAVVCLVVLVTGWSMLEAQAIRLHEVPVVAANLPPGTKPIRIVQISDLHLGGGTDGGRFAKMMEIIKQAQPDILISTGDLMDSNAAKLDRYAQALAELNPPMGKFAIPGNHEYYTGIAEAIAFHKAAGFTFLRNESRQVGDAMFIVGADDRAFYNAPPSDDNAFLPMTKHPGVFTLLLKHRPEVPESSLGRFDLQLSGHTHGGQIFPFNFVIAALYKYDRGLYELDKGSRVFVNRGAGTWGPPMRLGSPPEVSLIILQPPGGGN